MAELLYNAVDKRWDYIDDGDFTSAIASGNYLPPDNQPIYVVSPEGERSEVDLENAKKAISQGWSVETSDQRRRLLRDEEWGGVRTPFLVASSGFLSGLTGGASDIALRKGGELLGREAMVDEIAEMREDHSILGAAGQTAGLLAGGFVGFAPAALAASGAAKAGAAVAAAQGVTKATLAAKIAAGVAEAVPLSVGLAIGDAVLQDHDVDRELIAANIGLSTLIGGGVPALLGGAGKLGAAAAAKMAPHYAKVASRLAGEAIDDPVALAVEEASHPLLKKLAPIFGALSEGSTDDFVKLAAKDNARRLLQRSDKLLEKHVANVMADVDGAAASLGDLAKVFGRKGKFHATREKFAGVDGVQANQVARDSLLKLADDLDAFLDKEGAGELTSTFQKISGQARRRAHELSQRMASEFAPGSPQAVPVKGAAEATRRVRKTGAPSQDPGDLAMHAAQQLDEFKKDLGFLIQKRMGQMVDQNGVMVGQIASQEAIELLRGRGVYGRIREVLESDQVFGTSFATAQREINAAYHKVLDVDDVAKSMMRRVGTNEFGPLFKADDRKLRSLLTASHHQANLSFDMMQKYYNNIVDLSEAFAKHVDDKAVRAAARGAGKRAQRMLKNLDEARKDIGAHHLVGMFEKQSAGAISTSLMLGGLLGAQVGSEFGDPQLGASLGALGLAAMRRPAMFFRTAARYEQMKARFFGGMRTRTGAFVRGIPSKAKLSIRGPRVSRMAAISFTAQQTDEGESRAQSYARIMRELAMPDDVMSEKLRESLEPIADLSPTVASGIAERAAHSRLFLQAKAAELFGARAGGIINRELPPPESKLATWERYVRTVEDPIGTIGGVFTGMITPEEVETLQTLYPRLYQEVVAMLTEELASLKTPPPRHVQVQLSTFFNMGVDATAGRDFARKMWVRDMQTAGVPQPTNPAGHAGTVNRGQSQRVLEMHQTRGQRNQVA